MTVRPSVDVIIVNWNAGRWLEGALRALAAARPAACELGRVVVVDNASTDGSADALEAAAAGLPLTVVRNDANRGFGIASNQGAARSGADYLLFLNPDTRLVPGAIDRLIEGLAAAGEGYAVAGPRLLGERAQDTAGFVRFPTMRTFVQQALGLRARWRRSVRLNVPADEIARRGPFAVDVVSGACLLVRRDVFERLGGFDERFFAYYEEIDLCRRARTLGQRALLVPGLEVFHHDGACSVNVPAWRLFCSLRSRLTYARIHFPGWHVALLGVLMCGPEPVLRLARAVAGRGPDRPRDVADAYRRFAQHVLGARATPPTVR